MPDVEVKDLQSVELHSPFLENRPIRIIVCRDGVAFLSTQPEPPPGWYIAGGPALMADSNPTRTSAAVRNKIRNAGLEGKSIGIYRIIVPDPWLERHWHNLAPPMVTSFSPPTAKPIDIEIYAVDINEIVRYLTFGVFGGALPLPFESNPSPWEIGGLFRIGFTTADRNHRRFLNYFRIIQTTKLQHFLDYLSNRNAAADIDSLFRLQVGGGYLDVGKPSNGSRAEITLRNTAQAIDELIRILEQEPHAEERRFQILLERNPLILDRDAESVVSRPKFRCPPGEQINGKSYVEPDFVLKKGSTYVVVEIERAAKPIQRREGQPMSTVTQAVHQLAEFRSYISKYSSLLQDRFPGMRSANTKYWIIIGRSSSLREEDALELARSTFAVDEFLTFDELVERARSFLRKLQ